jgi:hypothetical protein
MNRNSALGIKSKYWYLFWSNDALVINLVMIMNAFKFKMNENSHFDLSE